jgi:hypothetical protein
VVSAALAAAFALTVPVAPASSAVEPAARGHGPIVGESLQAAYAPCSTISWRYDAAAEPGSASRMLLDVRGALLMLGDRTGLSFQEVPAESAADLVFDWSSLAGYPADTQAAAWRSGVTFAVGGEMGLDRWAGFGRKAVRRADRSFDVGIGRGWLVVHEVMHSLGFAHSDEAGSVMAPMADITNVLGAADRRRELRALRRPGFSPGDLANLAAMYPRSGCPRDSMGSRPASGETARSVGTAWRDPALGT